MRQAELQANEERSEENRARASNVGTERIAPEPLMIMSVSG